MAFELVLGVILLYFWASVLVVLQTPRKRVHATKTLWGGAAVKANGNSTGMRKKTRFDRGPVSCRMLLLFLAHFGMLFVRFLDPKAMLKSLRNNVSN